MRKHLLLLLSLLMIVSCNESKKRIDKKSEKNIQNPIISKIHKSNILLMSKNTDTLVIRSKCALVYEPTEKNIEKRKKEVGEEDFYVGADDFLYYINESTEFLKSKNVTIVTTENDKILKFILNDGSIVVKNLDLEKEMFGIFLFDSKKEPQKIDITATEEEYETYMK
ncbi:hypothetical protein ACYE2N_00085 [Flavobacterium sp. MAHUQ-51]|uniref:hypothetical protein n=1 Tax=Flavobacterium sp. GCM10022190 TaxID=3252639 RepID=UPI00360D7C06